MLSRAFRFIGRVEGSGAVARSLRLLDAPALRGQPATFLLDRATVELDDRRSAVNRRFRAILELGGADPALAALAARHRSLTIFSVTKLLK